VQTDNRGQLSTEDGAFVEDLPEASRKNELKQRKKLSVTSSKYDVGNKGVLDETELKIRAYDTNNDGTIDISELKNIIGDLKENSDKKNMFKKLSIATLSTLAIVLLCNFGLVWATLILTRQIETKNGDLVESSTGLRVSTQAHGNHIIANVNPEFTRRLIDLHARRALSRAIDGDVDHFRENIRQLQANTPMATLEQTEPQINQAFNDYVDGVRTGVSTSIAGVTYSGIIASGVTSSKEDGCTVLDHIKDQNDSGGIGLTLKLQCCGDMNCDVYDITESEDVRRLENEWGDASCFSLLSTVVERSKGRMLLKDLKPTDMILAAGGTYRPFLFWIHSHPSQETSFVQIFTSPLEDAPLEVTKNHLVFLHGKGVPIQAGDVKVGDLMVGVNAPRTVTKIATVTRKGYVNLLTSDATLVVNGVLASSAAVQTDAEAQYLHAVLKMAAPLFQVGCKINPFFCDTQVDVRGASMNIVVHLAVLVTKLPFIMQLFIYPSFIIVTIVGIVGYHLFQFLVLSWSVVLVTLTLFQLQKKSKKA